MVSSFFYRVLHFSALGLACAIVGLLGTTAQAAPRVVASIKPIDSLVAGVMAGTNNVPYLLVPGASSPHTYSLRPSDMAALHRARVVFWVGPMLETFLTPALANLSPRVHVIALYKAPGVRLLPVNVGFGAPAVTKGSTHQGTASARTLEAAINPHLWLDPHNAAAMVADIAKVLSTIDPANAPRYQANAQSLTTRLSRLDRHLVHQLAPVQHVPFLVYHDAYAYFDTRYDLHAVGALTVEPSLPPGARRVEAARRAIRQDGVRCLFREPEFESPIIRTVTAGTAVRIGVLDPLGANLTPGPELYFELMRNLGTHLESCLAH